MTYRLVQRNRNSWLQHDDGRKEYQIENTCGHNHRTLEGAIRCRRAHAGTTLGVLGEVEDSSGRTMRQDAELYHRAEQAVHESAQR
jgi:hypothetical protein